MANYGVVGEVFQWTVPPGEPAPALLITGVLRRHYGRDHNVRPLISVEQQWQAQAPRAQVVAAHVVGQTFCCTRP